jgi:hypothetical protein
VTTPNAPIIKAMPNPTFRGAVLVTILCPFCGKKHGHGVPAQDVGGEYGSRVAHCSSGEGGVYVLTDPDGLVGCAGADGGQAGAGSGHSPNIPSPTGDMPKVAPACPPAASSQVSGGLGR